jgi:hypothetical protein
MTQTPEEDFQSALKRRRAHRNLVLGAFLVGLVILMYMVTLVKLSRQKNTQELAEAVLDHMETSNE